MLSEWNPQFLLNEDQIDLLAKSHIIYFQYILFYKF